jgi:hypothetical protein
VGVGERGRSIVTDGRPGQSGGPGLAAEGARTAPGPRAWCAAGGGWAEAIPSGRDLEDASPGVVAHPSSGRPRVPSPDGAWGSDRGRGGAGAGTLEKSAAAGNYCHNRPESTPAWRRRGGGARGQGQRVEGGTGRRGGVGQRLATARAGPGTGGGAVYAVCAGSAGGAGGRGRNGRNGRVVGEIAHSCGEGSWARMSPPMGPVQGTRAGTLGRGIGFRETGTGQRPVRGVWAANQRKVQATIQGGRARQGTAPQQERQEP